MAAAKFTAEVAAYEMDRPRKVGVVLSAFSPCRVAKEVREFEPCDFTVKSHGTWGLVKQTTVLRVKFKEA